MRKFMVSLEGSCLLQSSFTDGKVFVMAAQMMNFQGKSV